MKKEIEIIIVLLASLFYKKKKNKSPEKTPRDTFDKTKQKERQLF